MIYREDGTSRHVGVVIRDPGFIHGQAIRDALKRGDKLVLVKKKLTDKDTKRRSALSQ